MRIWRSLLNPFTGLLLLALLLVGALYMGRYFLAETLTKSALSRAGFDDVRISVAKVSLDSLRYETISARHRDSGAGVTVGAISARYRFAQVLSNRELEELVVEDVEATVSSRWLGSLDQSRSAGANGTASWQGIPVAALTLKNITISLEGGDGQGTLTLDGAITKSKGGTIALKGVCSKIPYKEVMVEDASFSIAIDLIEDGDRFQSQGALDFSAVSDVVRAEGITLGLSASGTGWGAFLAGNAEPLSADAQLTLADGELISAAPIKLLMGDVSPMADDALSIGVSGNLIGRKRGSTYRVLVDETSPLRASTAKRGLIELNQLQDEDLLFISEGERKIAAQATFLQGDSLGAARLRAIQVTGAAMTFDASADLLSTQIAGVELGSASLASQGTVNASVLDASLAMSAMVERAGFGRFSLANAPIHAAFDLAADREKGILTLSSGESNGCIDLDSIEIKVKDPALVTVIETANLCRPDGPLLAAFWPSETGRDGEVQKQVSLAGTLTAQRTRFKMGDTKITGMPPTISFQADYQPDQHLTSVDGILHNGDMTINDALRANRSAGTFTLRLDEDALTGSADLSALRLSQAKGLAMIAPLDATGKAALRDHQATFTYRLQTPGGTALGDGTGRYDIAKAKGSTRFSTGDVRFTPRGLQPAQLAPVLRGHIFEADGNVRFDTRFDWDKRGVRSAGTFVLDNLSFGGPGVAVTRTEGVSGTVKLTNLMPLQSDGEQLLQIGRVDLDALELIDGEARFNLPGNDRLEIIRAEFPWFGGVIGAYDSSVVMADGQARTALRANNVDIGQLLSYVAVDGLSGEGEVEGVLPLVFEGGRARIEQGRMSAIGPGVIRYRGQATQAAGTSNRGAKMAFDMLRNLEFERLTAEINGPLDGDLAFKLYFEGQNEITLDDQRVKEKVVSPVIYRINLEAPILALIQNARESADYRKLIERSKSATE